MQPLHPCTCTRRVAWPALALDCLRCTASGKGAWAPAPAWAGGSGAAPRRGSRSWMSPRMPGIVPAPWGGEDWSRRGGPAAWPAPKPPGVGGGNGSHPEPSSGSACRACVCMHVHRRVQMQTIWNMHEAHQDLLAPASPEGADAGAAPAAAAAVPGATPRSAAGFAWIEAGGGPPCTGPPAAGRATGAAAGAGLPVGRVMRVTAADGRLFLAKNSS